MANPRSNPVGFALQLLFIAFLIFLGVKIVGLFKTTPGGGGGGGGGTATLSAHTAGWSVDAAKHIRVAVSVTNTSDHDVTPQCTFTVVDADGFALSADVFTADAPLAPGENHLYSVITGLVVGANQPADVQSSCTG